MSISSRTKIKICGLMSEQDAEYVSEACADFAGVILAPDRKRTVSAETVKRIRRALNPDIPLTGVFVNAQIAEICAFAEKGLIQLVQLHGQEDAAYLMKLRKRCSLPVIQAFRIESERDLRQAEHSEADLVLLDHGIGGTGEGFDLSLLEKGFSRPFLLAGGLHPGNVAAAVSGYRPCGVDVSSGVETDGRKDSEKMKAFVTEVRHADKEQEVLL
ncbi:MAG: phosphoribosylanthranilate isomerase [Oscillospiraceae bacterium]|nr:phosphoribosylanthranilate isomerase [Oscillospiraceae bacterium]